jgi:Pseudouridylate synthases, 23S RNA-specific
MKNFTATQECGLLDFLLDTVNKSRNSVKSLLKNKAVRVDGTPVTQFDYRLRAGQVVSLSGSKSVSNSIILYENAEIIVINKPSGLLSIATDSEKEQTAYRMMTEHVRASDPKSRVFIVHRLDKDTSGLLLFAKSQKLKTALQDNWNELVKTRGYMAVVEGVPQKPADTIRSFLKETTTHVMYSADSGLEAITEYQTVKSANGYSLLELHLKTGRKNQIRVHMKELGTPVVGDKKYGSKQVNPLKRLGLHAHLLELVHPVSRKLLRFTAAVPAEFTKLMK